MSIRNLLGDLSKRNNSAEDDRDSNLAKGTDFRCIDYSHRWKSRPNEKYANCPKCNTHRICFLANLKQADNHTKKKEVWICLFDFTDENDRNFREIGFDREKDITDAIMQTVKEGSCWIGKNDNDIMYFYEYDYPKKGKITVMTDSDGTIITAFPSGEVKTNRKK